MTKAQEGHKKDVDRLFRVLQGRSKNLRGDFLVWIDTALMDIVQTCVILHSMLIRLSLGSALAYEDDSFGKTLNP